MPDSLPQSHIFGGGVTSSIMSPAVAVVLVLLSILILTLPRKYVVIPFLSGTFLIWLPAQFYFAGVHWLGLRILTLVALVRVVLPRSKGKDGLFRFAGGLTGIDRAFAACILAQAICVMLLFQQTQALVNQFGFLIDFLGGYFVIRFLIRDESDIYRALKCLAFLSAVLAVGMVIEQLWLTNYFARLAGVVRTPDIREGKIRSQGVFQHAIPAGTVAATWIQMFILLWRNGKSKLMAGLGLVGATVMTVTSQSSTPLLAYAASVLGVLMWPLRARMKLIRRGLVAAVLLLALVMKAPVWFLIARIDLTGGSSGYHRALIVDQFIRHFWDWWLIGVRDTSQWGWDLWDVQNQYVAAGESGGLIAFCYFVALIVRSFVRLGKARKQSDGNQEKEWLYWLLSCALFSNALAFIGANYFDQSRISWFVLVASIGAATASAVQPQAVVGAVRLPARKREVVSEMTPEPVHSIPRYP
jgi:hypothetical protein